MTELDRALELAAVPERWYVDLVSGDVLEVLTHGYSIEDGRYRFSLLFRGSPNLDVTVLSIPASLVRGTRDDYEEYIP